MLWVFWRHCSIPRLLGQRQMVLGREWLFQDGVPLCSRTRVVVFLGWEYAEEETSNLVTEQSSHSEGSKGVKDPISLPSGKEVYVPYVFPICVSFWHASWHNASALSAPTTSQSFPWLRGPHSSNPSKGLLATIGGFPFSRGCQTRQRILCYGMYCVLGPKKPRGPNKPI